MSIVDRVLSEYLASLEPDIVKTEPPLDLREHAARIGVLPVYRDMGGCYALRSDATVVSFSWDNPEDISVETDERLMNLAMFQGARRYPELKSLVPDRPSTALQCTFCGGSGEATELPDHLRQHVVCYCGGLGWVPAPRP